MRSHFFVLSLLLVAGCDGGSSQTVDAGRIPDRNVDSGSPSPGIDSGTPMPGVDAGPTPTAPDAGPRPTPDAGPPGAPDAGPPMSTSGADPRPGYIGCGDTSCMSPQVCCVSLSGQTCGAASSCSGGFSAAGHCDGREDCGSGQACCVHFGMFDPNNGAFCRDGGGCPSGDNQLCHTNADCGSGSTCVRCAPPTGGFLDVVYGICSRDGRCPSPYTAAR